MSNNNTLLNVYVATNRQYGEEIFTQMGDLDEFAKVHSDSDGFLKVHSDSHRFFTLFGVFNVHSDGGPPCPFKT